MTELGLQINLKGRKPFFLCKKSCWKIYIFQQLICYFELLYKLRMY